MSELITLKEAASMIGAPYGAFRKKKSGDAKFPTPKKRKGKNLLYAKEDIWEWFRNSGYSPGAYGKQDPHIKNGGKFGKLTVISDTGERKKNGARVILCECECGNTLKVVAKHLTQGRTKSCGCLIGAHWKSIY